MYDIRRGTLISYFTVQRPCSSAKVCKKQAEGRRPWEWETKHVWPYPTFFLPNRQRRRRRPWQLISLCGSRIRILAFKLPNIHPTSHTNFAHPRRPPSPSSAVIPRFMSPACSLPSQSDRVFIDLGSKRAHERAKHSAETSVAAPHKSDLSKL